MAFIELSRRMIAALLSGDRDDRKFEQFCADVFTEMEGVQYETTSRGGDLGRDAKSDFLPEGGVARICATIQRNGWVAKAKSDIDKVSRSALHINRLRLCTNQSVKEAQLDEILSYAQSKLLNCKSITAHALSGMTDLAFRRQRVIRASYSREIDEQAIWFQRHAREDDDDERSLSLLRVALSTLFSPDVVQMRQRLLRTLVANALSDGEKDTIKGLGMRAAAAMKLGSIPERSFWLNALQELEVSGFVKKEGSWYSLTSPGIAHVDELVELGTESSLTGRAAVKELFEKNGEPLLSNDAFSSLWSVIQRNVEELFLMNGLAVVEEVRQLLSGTTKPSAIPLLTRLIGKLITHVTSMQLSLQVEADVVRVLQDMFVQQDSEAFDWMSKLAAKYLVLASVGLDASFQRELAERASFWVIVPDTHVMLSYLCEGDEGHAAAKIVLSQLNKLQAEIQATDPVLEETLHHAALATHNFREYFDRLTAAIKLDNTLSPLAVVHPTDNAFVKGFASVVELPVSKAKWIEYLGQFLNADEKDVSSLLATLKAELRITYMEDTADIISVGEAYANQIFGSMPSDEIGISTLRCKWDGRLLAGVLVRGKTYPAVRRTIIVSESSRVRTTVTQHLGEPQKKLVKVVALDALSFALASMPGTTVNLECVRHFLFGASGMIRLDHVSTRVLISASSGTERLLLRHGLHRRLEDKILRG